MSTNPVTGDAVVATAVLSRGLGTIVARGCYLGWAGAPGWLDSVVTLDARAQGSTIELGRDSFIGNGSSLISEGPGIEIEEEVLIGAFAMIADSDFHDLHPQRRRGGVPAMGKVTIRRNVFLGHQVTVLKGVTIGADSVIAAGSVVTRSVPAGVIAGGNPCRVIRALSASH